MGSGEAKCTRGCPCPRCLPRPRPRREPKCEDFSDNCHVCVLMGCEYQPLHRLGGRRLLLSYLPPPGICTEGPKLGGRRVLASEPIADRLSVMFQTNHFQCQDRFHIQYQILTDRFDRGMTILRQKIERGKEFVKESNRLWG